MRIANSILPAPLTRGSFVAACSQGVRRFVAEMWYTGNENWKEDLSLLPPTFIARIDRRLRVTAFALVLGFATDGT